MVFIETPVFTRQVKELLTDDEYGQFQQCLAAHPKMGRVIQGTGGCARYAGAMTAAARAAVFG